MTNQWINCSERMPEVGVPVLIVGKSGWMSICSYTGPEKGPAYPENFIWEERDDCHIRSAVTHWMPLPAGPSDEPTEITGEERCPICRGQLHTGLDSLVGVGVANDMIQFAHARCAERTNGDV